MREYTFQDALYWLGLMAGAGITYKGLEAYGVESHIVRLIGALIVGVGAGWILEQLYGKKKKG